MQMTIPYLVVAMLTTATLFGLCVGFAKRGKKSPQAKDGAELPVMLFDGDLLVDATPQANMLLGITPDRLNDLRGVLTVLMGQFPNLAADIAELPKRLHLRSVSAVSGSYWIDLEYVAGCTRMTLRSNLDSVALSYADILAQESERRELDMLRDLMCSAPQMIWQVDEKERVVWANRTYLDFHDKVANRRADSLAVWPEKPLFEALTVDEGTPAKRRLSFGIGEPKKEHWFEITSVRRGVNIFHFASDANAVMRAESAQRNFVQTLSKTFADLSIGLAIFDRKRQLAMFNPALHDMTSLPVTFLSSRPMIDTVLDRLRESRMLPEPKNYTSWREQFYAVEQEAKQGTYCENWNLPNGQTYRVTGRPHPDGAIALLFEDISAEVSLTRRFRSDIETGQAVLDSLPDAIAVFSQTGTMVMTNNAYSVLLGVSADDMQFDHDLRSGLQSWQSKCGATSFWADLRRFATGSGQRSAISDVTILEDGRHLSCAAEPISGGMTLVKFAIVTPTRPVLQKLTQIDPALRQSKV